MTDTRIIKKYPNRRLYDTAISSYITLADVKRLVLDGVEFQVVDAKSQEDLTRTILLQIISEEEEGGKPIFSAQLLAQLIQAYGGNTQNMLTSYLEKSMELWGEQQRMLRERTREFMDQSPMTVLAQFAEQNLQMWRQLSGWERGEGDGEPDDDGPSGDSSLGEEAGQAPSSRTTSSRPHEPPDPPASGGGQRGATGGSRSHRRRGGSAGRA